MRDWIWHKFSFIWVFRFIIQGIEKPTCIAHTGYLQEIKGSSSGSQTFPACFLFSCFFTQHCLVLITEDRADVIIWICLNPHGPCHSCYTEQSRLPPSHRSAVRAGHFIWLLSLCSSLSPSEHKDLARVITTGEAFNCSHHHCTSGGSAKAVKMPQRKWNETTL